MANTEIHVEIAQSGGEKSTYTAISPKEQGFRTDGFWGLFGGQEADFRENGEVAIYASRDLRYNNLFVPTRKTHGGAPGGGDSVPTGIGVEALGSQTIWPRTRKRQFRSPVPPSTISRTSSGKSSLAFDTIYAEGRRKYVESLSAYARQFLEQMQKPAVSDISGLPPTIAIEQRSASSNPRSTVATTTEIYDYFRLLFARVGQPHCWVCGREITSQHSSQIVESIVSRPEGTKIQVCAPLVRGKKGEHREVFADIQREGFVRVRVDGSIYDIHKPVSRSCRPGCSASTVPTAPAEAATGWAPSSNSTRT